MPKDRLDDGVPTTAELDLLRDSAEDAPPIPVLLKSGNWEKRLAEARERRAAVLAAREAAKVTARPGRAVLVKIVAQRWRPAAWLALGALCGVAITTLSLRENPEADAFIAAPVASQAAPATLSTPATGPEPGVAALAAPPRTAALSPDRLAPARGDGPVPRIGVTQQAPRAMAWTAMPPSLTGAAPASARAFATPGLLTPVQIMQMATLARAGAPDAVPSLSSSPGAALSDLRLVVFAPASLEPGAVAPTLETLDDLGLPVTRANRVDVSIREGHLRLYHDADRAAAARVAEATGVAVRDFTEYAPSPPSGTIELWLAGHSGAAQPSRPVGGLTRRVDALVSRLGGGNLSGVITRRSTSPTRQGESGERTRSAEAGGHGERADASGHDRGRSGSDRVDRGRSRNNDDHGRSNDDRHDDDEDDDDDDD